MASGSFQFDRFRLDPDDRLLTRDGAPVELSSRYFDALALMVREQGRLVSKDRFMDEVWRGVPVTDEALTQCIRTLRRRLGDDAVRPRFIETAPKHGYRFIAAVETVETPTVEARPTGDRAADSPRAWGRLLPLGFAGTAGGGVAGVAGGLIYGLVGASDGMEASSALLVLICLTALVGVMGGAAVSFGMAAAEARTGRIGPLMVLGAATGGVLIGGVTKLLGLDAFNLLFGQAPAGITGAGEGLLLGAAVGLGGWLGGRTGRLRRGVPIAGLCGAVAGALIPLMGGRLMAGSLDSLADSFPRSRLDVDGLGGLFGQGDFGLLPQVVAGALEGLLFSACVVGAVMLARRTILPRRAASGEDARLKS